MPRSCAIFTLVRNEAQLLPVWLRYYSRFVPLDQLFVLDNDSDDGSTTDIPAVVTHCSSDTAFDHPWMVSTINLFQQKLQQQFDTVLYADADEFVVPRTCDLGEYLDASVMPVVRSMGYNIVQNVDEGAIDWSCPLLNQRMWMSRHTQFDKPVISRIPITYSLGCHSLNSGPVPEPDRDLVLLHVHLIDREWCVERHRWKRSLPWHAQSLSQGWGFQNSLPTDEAVRAWYANSAVSLELIPDELKVF